MIEAKFTTKDGHYNSYSLSGHADHAPHGQDIVCAGVSALFIGISNVLLSTFGALDKSTINKKVIEIVNANEQTGLLTETLYKSLIDIEKEHPSNLKVYVNSGEHQGGSVIIEEVEAEAWTTI